MAKGKLPRYQCKKCNHVWIPRSDQYPRICPKCKSIRWDKDKFGVTVTIDKLGGNNV